MTRIRNVLIIVSIFMLSACFDDEDEGSASISGTLTSLQNSAADSDVNDIGTRFSSVSNDTIATAQALPNPVILGGYLNLPKRGVVFLNTDGELEGGRSYEDGDVIDVYNATLKEGDVLTLTVAENADLSDFQISLIDQNSEVLNKAIRNAGSQSTSLTVAVDDIVDPISGLKRSYFIAISTLCGNILATTNCTFLPFSYKGYSNYTLRIAQAASQNANQSSVNINTDFIPGDIVVKFKPASFPAAASLSNKAALSKVAGVFGMQVKNGAMNRVSLLKLGDTAVQRKNAFSALGLSSSVAKMRVSKSDTKKQLKLDTLLAIQALRRNPAVEYAEPNFIRRASLIPNDANYDSQWHYPLINLPQAWDISTGARAVKPVIVAVVDTGVLLDHPDFRGVFPSLESQLVLGYDFISDSVNSGDGDGNVGSDIDSNPDDPGDKNNFDGSSSFHGTHVAGTIAARTDNLIGVAGVAWQAKIMPIRVMGTIGGASYDIMQGLLYAAGLPNDSNQVPAQIADIVNLSLGGPCGSTGEQETINEIRRPNIARGTAGVIVVAAAGNENTSTPSCPAALNGVISVSAVGSTKLRSSYSNFGSSIDVSAPGGDSNVDSGGNVGGDLVVSLGGDDSGGAAIKYKFNKTYVGTSMAAPHVAGVLALMRAINPEISPAAMDVRLASGELTDDIGATGRDDNYGHGLINAFKAVISASDGVTSVGAVLASTQNILNFGATGSALKFNLINIGDAEVTVDTVTPDQDWLSVIAGAVVDPLIGLGEYTATINRSGLSFGNYSATITATTVGANSTTLSVSMQVIDPATAAKSSVGKIYLILIDPVTRKTRGQVTPTLANGKYTYSLPNIPPRRYLIYAGADPDNDTFICGKLVACGAHGGLARPSAVSLGADSQYTFDFTVNFDQSLASQSFASLDSTSERPGIPRKFAPIGKGININ